MPLEGKGDTDKVGPVGKGEGVGESAGCKFCYVTALWNKVFAFFYSPSLASLVLLSLPQLHQPMGEQQWRWRAPK
jgi:hypothetical protein